MTPDEQTATHQAIWADRGAAVGRTFPVPPCPYAADEIEALTESGRRLAYLPPELATRAGRAGLGALFPQLGCYSVLADNVVDNVANPSGWFDYEVAVDAPRRDLDEPGLLAVVEGEGRSLLTLNQYLVAAHDSKLLTGRYLDEGATWTRVASRLGDGLVAAHMDGDDQPSSGALLLGYDLRPTDKTPLCGGRSTTIPAWGRGLVEEPPPVERWTAPAGSLDADLEWERMVDAYIRLGFPTELRMSHQVYATTLPRVARRPEALRGPFDVPLVVETRISWRRQAQLAGINLAGFDLCPEPVPVDQRQRVPTRPYGAWFASWAQRFPTRIAPPEARDGLGDDEVAGNPFEAVAMAIHHPEYLEHGQFWDVLGYVVRGSAVDGMAEVDEERTLSIYRWRGRTELCANLHQDAFEIFRPLVRSAAIVTSPHG